MGSPGTLDLARQGDYFWALLPEIVLALWAMGVLLADVFQKGNRSQPSAASGPPTNSTASPISPGTTSSAPML